jgi:GTPase
VVDGSHPDPAGQLAAVREVLSEIGAVDVPELVVVNKADIADRAFLRRLSRDEPDVLAVSARTGQGLEELRNRIADRLPRPDVDVDVLVPYDRGDVVARLHAAGSVVAEEHTVDGTRIQAQVPRWMVDEMSGFAVAGSTT